MATKKDKLITELNVCMKKSNLGSQLSPISKHKSLFDTIDQKYNEIMQQIIIDEQKIDIKDLIKAEIRNKSEIFIKLLRNELRNFQMDEIVVRSLYMRERDKKLRCDFLNTTQIKKQIDYFVEHEGLLWSYNVIDYFQIQNNSVIFDNPDLKAFVENEIRKVHKNNLKIFRNEFAHLYTEISVTVHNSIESDSYNDHSSFTKREPECDNKQLKKHKSSLASTLESPELPLTPEMRFRPFF